MSLIIVLILSIPVALLRGLALSSMIGWFTTFHVGMVQAIGLAAIVALLTSHLTTPEMKPGQSNLEFGIMLLLQQTIVIATLWALAYVWHLFL